jgi:hypothetical protein
MYPACTAVMAEVIGELVRGGAATVVGPRLRTEQHVPAKGGYAATIVKIIALDGYDKDSLGRTPLHYAAGVVTARPCVCCWRREQRSGHVTSAT